MSTDGRMERLSGENERCRIEKLVLAFCGQNGLFVPFASAEETPRVWAAVSGGADSMALLRLLCANAAGLGIRVAACHVNHGLRGATADRDERFVREECEALGVPLRVFRAAEEGMPPPENAGEDWARRLRYHCFEKLCRNGNECVATAHTLTDQTETLLFRLARGTGLHGAAGIPARRGAFVRPLLCLTRAETERYCAALSQTFVTDETNLSDDYARNRLRHYALPALRAANEAAEQNFGHFCEKAARADAYFAALADEALDEAARQAVQTESRLTRSTAAADKERPCAVTNTLWALAPLQKVHPLVREALAHRLISPVRDAEEKYVRLLCTLIENGSGALQLRTDVRFSADGAFLRREVCHAPRRGAQETNRPALLAFTPRGGACTVCRGTRTHDDRAINANNEPETQSFADKGTAEHEALKNANRLPLAQGRPLAAGKYTVYGQDGRKICFELDFFPEKTQSVHKKDLKNEADYARIAMLYNTLTIRARLPGDYFRPAGRGVGKSLKKLFNEAAVPPSLRSALPLIAAGNEVLWLYGFGFAQGLAPDAKTRTVLRILSEEISEDVES